MQTEFVIVPLTRNDFKKLSDPLFLQLLGCFGVKVNQAGQAYPRVHSGVQKETFTDTLKLMQQTFERYEEVLDKAQIESMDV